MNTISDLILQQLGGNKFLCMTGAKHLVNGGNSLKMDIPHAICNKIKISGVRIILMPDDTYTIEAFKIVRLTYTVVDTMSDVYVEALRRTFTKMTGVYVTL